MPEKKRPRAILVCESTREDFLRTSLDLRNNSDYEWLDTNQCKSLLDFKGKNIPTQTAVFIDAKIIVEGKLLFEEGWKFWNTIVVVEDSQRKMGLEKWNGKCSVIDLSEIKGAELISAMEFSLSQEKYPGIFVFLEKGTEIFFEKIQTLVEIGAKVDRFCVLLEKMFPNHSPQMFNLRQLSYSLLHEGVVVSKAYKEQAPIVDFQIAADAKKICFAVRFNASERTFATWKETLNSGTSSRWQTARSNSSILVLTELSGLNQCEIKAVLRNRDPSAVDDYGCLFLQSIRKFIPDADSLARQKTAKFSPLRDLPTVNLPKGQPTANPQNVDESEENEEEKSQVGNELNFKLKADMLANEKEDLQALVKKKTLLIAGLTKDVNKAQSEVTEAQKAASKELLKMRMEVEREKNATKDALKKLAQMERRLNESNESGEKSKGKENEQRNWENDYKTLLRSKELIEQKLADATSKIGNLEGIMQRQRKEIGEITAQKNELKTSIHKMEQEAAKSERIEMAKATVEARQAEPVAASPDRYLEMTKKFTEAKTAKDEAEKEQKRLQMKLETAEKNLIAQAGHSKKHHEGIEKALEEAKKQKTEAAKKLDEMRAEMKKKVEEMNASERVLRKKADDLAEQLKAKTADYDRLVRNAEKKAS